MRTILSIATIAGLLASTAAQAQDAAVFRPSSVWAADYGDDYCRLVREFSDGRDTINLAFQRVQPGADTQLLLIGNAVRTFRGANQISWHFLPNDAERRTPYSRSETGDGQQYLRMDNVMLVPFTPPAPGAPFGPPPVYNRAAEQARTKEYTGLTLTAGLTRPVQIDTGPLDGPIAALQACADDLLSTWGLDPQKHQTLTATPVPQPRPDGFLPTGTIPFSEFGKFAGGGNVVRLMLDAAGKPTSCHIHSPTLNATLNTRICALLMERASFTPAKDADGQGMASYWMGSPMFLGPAPAGGGRRR